MLTLRRGSMEAEVLTYGAALRALRVPDRNGGPVDVVLGYDAVSAYEANAGIGTPPWEVPWAGAPTALPEPPASSTARASP